MNTTFSKLPTSWVRKEYLKNFGVEKLAINISALKCYLALSLYMDFYKQLTNKTTYELSDITNMSRPIIYKGLRKLEELNMITTNKLEHKHTYILNNIDEDEGWAKLPRKQMLAALKEMNNYRNRSTLWALKVYIYLLSIRNNTSSCAQAGYEKITRNTHIQSVQVRPAIDILINHNLISINKEQNIYNKTNPPNKYQLIGL